MKQESPAIRIAQRGVSVPEQAFPNCGQSPGLSRAVSRLDLIMQAHERGCSSCNIHSNDEAWGSPDTPCQLARLEVLRYVGFVLCVWSAHCLPLDTHKSGESGEHPRL
jgi:hypothetical protein